MSKLFLFLLVLLLITSICRFCVFPLSAGTVESGITATESIRQQTLTKKIYDYPFVAVIIEPREENLVNILTHFIKVMPTFTHFQVYHGTNNINVLYDNFKPDIQSGKISLWNLGVSNLTIQGYSALLTSKEFWNSVQSENVLIFQTDSITCRKSRSQIENFTFYDFVGAPIPYYISILVNIRFMLMGHIIGHSRYFNGGLSYRKRSKMLAVIEQYPWDGMWTEDIWFCAFLPRVGGSLPAREEARKFSFEAEKLSTIPWGIHKPRKKYNTLCEICPEFKQIPFIPSHTDYKSLYIL